MKPMQSLLHTAAAVLVASAMASPLAFAQTQDASTARVIVKFRSDSALLANLGPGNYTIQVSGVGGTSGVALVELYDLTPAAPAVVT